MFHNIRNRINYAWFNARSRGILETPGLKCDPGGPYVLSQLCQRDLFLYLVAIKSFGRFLRPSVVYVIDDGSLTEESHRLIREHVEKVEILDFKQFRSPLCPNGGTWERLLAIAQICQSGYVVQMDSDILTIGPIDEVVEHIHEGDSFLLGTRMGHALESMSDALGKAKNLLSPDSHVQVLAEANFDKLKDCREMRYMRGCSGFAGFPQNSISRQYIESLSQQMYAAIGKRWEEWGTEQVTSNIVLANYHKAKVLPFPDFCNCDQMVIGKSRLIHFMGICRFKDGIFQRHAGEIIRSLLA